MFRAHSADFLRSAGGVISSAKLRVLRDVEACRTKTLQLATKKRNLSQLSQILMLVGLVTAVLAVGLVLSLVGPEG